MTIKAITMNLLRWQAIILLAITSTSCKQPAPKINATEPGLIFPPGEQITNNNFNGKAFLNMLIEADSVNPTAVGNVTFEPGARTNWHKHPGGQILLVLDGEGYYQEKGQSKKIIHRGDVIKCPPDVSHWHGASANKRFVQIAVTNAHRGTTVWLNRVTDEEYNK